MSIAPYELKDGTKRYRVRYTHPDGTRTDKRGFTSKTAARKWEASIISGKTPMPARNEQPLHAYGELYLKTLKGKSANTIDLHTIALNKHVLPRWGRSTPSSITHQAIQQWVTETASSNSQATRNLAVLSGLLRLSGLSKKELPTQDVIKPAKAQQRNVYLSYTQLCTLAKECGTYEGIVLTLGMVGMRWGELAGLRVRDWDSKQQLLHLTQSATIVRGKLTLGPTKGGKPRTVIVPQKAATFIDAATLHRAGDSPIWPRRNGGYMLRPKGKSWFDGALKRVRAKDEAFPTLRLHDLRHTAASLMVQSGAHVKLIQHQLGHASAAMTLDVYSDLYPEDLSSLRDAMNQKFSGQDVGTTPDLSSETAGHGG